MPKLFRSEVEKSARARALPALAKTFKVKVAKLGDQATAMGAAAWAKESLDSEG